MLQAIMEARWAGPSHSLKTRSRAVLSQKWLWIRRRADMCIARAASCPWRSHTRKVHSWNPMDPVREYPTIIIAAQVDLYQALREEEEVRPMTQPLWEKSCLTRFYKVLRNSWRRFKMGSSISALLVNICLSLWMSKRMLLEFPKAPNL